MDQPQDLNPDPATPPAPERDGPAWEWRTELGTWRALTLTMKEVLFHPKEAFRRMRVAGGYGAPFTFYLIMNMTVGFVSLLLFRMSLASAIQQINALLAGNSMLDAATARSIREFLAGLQGVSLSSIVIPWLLLYPIVLLFLVWSLALQSHVLLLACRGANARLEATFRATAYVGGACAILSLIPILGSLIWFVCWTVLYIVALAEVHRTQVWRATVAVVLPILILVVLVFFLLLAFAALFYQLQS